MAIDDDAEIGKRYPKDSDQGAKNIVDLVRALKEYREGISGRIEQLESSVDGIDSAIQSAVSEQVATLQQELATVDSRIASAVAAVRNQILDGVGEDFDTLMELANAIGDNADLIGGLQDVAKSHVRYDGAQTLTDAQKTQARANIGAADDADVVHRLGNIAETISGRKTFTGELGLQGGGSHSDTCPGVSAAFKTRRVFVNDTLTDNIVIPANTAQLSIKKYTKQVGGAPTDYEVVASIDKDGVYHGDVAGNADTATKATQDANGNNIADTYLTENAIESISVDGEQQPITNKNVDIKTVFEGSGDDNPDLNVFDGTEDPAKWTGVDTTRKAVLDITTVAPNSFYISSEDNCSFVCKKPFFARLTAISISSKKSNSLATCAIYLNGTEMVRATCSSTEKDSVGEASFEFPLKAGDVIQCGNPATTGWPLNGMRIEAVGVGGSTKSFIWSINGKRTANHELEIAEVATSGSYSDLSDTPTKLSEFENDVPYVRDKLDEKTYTNVVINGTSTSGKCEHYTVGFATIAPASWSSQWKVRLRIEASILATNGNTYVSQIESTIYGYGNVNSVSYANFNSFTSSSYRPFNYLSVLRPVDGSQLADYPFRLCFLGASQTNATAHYSRTIKVTLLEQINCVCSLFDNASTNDYQTYYHDLLATVKAQAKSIGYWTYSSASSQTFNSTSLNCVDYGLQETGDANSIDRQLDNYFRPYAGTSIIYGYKLCMMGDDNRLYPLVTTNSNAFNKVVQTIPLRPDSVWYYSSSSQTNAGALTGGGLLYKTFPVANCKYTFNTDIATYQTVYLCGDFDAETGLFTLETKDKNGNASITDFYVQVPMNAALTNKATYFRTGKYYILLGGSYSTVNYMQLFIEHPMFYFDGTNLVPVIASAVRATADADGNKFSEVYAKKTDILLGPAGPTGPRGYTFTPSVSAAGVLSWTNNGGLDNPASVTIKGADGAAGAKGDKGDKGDTGSQGPQGPTGPRGYTFTPSVSAAGVLSWSNNGGLSNPASFDFSSIGLGDVIDLGGLS